MKKAVESILAAKEAVPTFKDLKTAIVFKHGLPSFKLKSSDLPFRAPAELCPKDLRSPGAPERDKGHAEAQPKAASPEAHRKRHTDYSDRSEMDIFFLPGSRFRRFAEAGP